jgi:hypothetical protein
VAEREVRRKIRRAVRSASASTKGKAMEIARLLHERMETTGRC